MKVWMNEQTNKQTIERMIEWINARMKKKAIGWLMTWSMNECISSVTSVHDNCLDIIPSNSTRNKWLVLTYFDLFWSDMGHYWLSDVWLLS